MAGCCRHVLHPAARRHERVLKDRILAGPTDRPFQLRCEESRSFTLSTGHLPCLVLPCRRRHCSATTIRAQYRRSSLGIPSCLRDFVVGAAKKYRQAAKTQQNAKELWVTGSTSESPGDLSSRIGACRSSSGWSCPVPRWSGMKALSVRALNPF